ncbi:MAG: T9SS type A sorting domain-containing protein [Bacteroidota bacterium]
MKKLFLLFAAGTVAFSSQAQERKIGFVQDIQDLTTPKLSKTFKASDVRNAKATGAAAKTTATDRWYNYGDYLDTVQQLAGQATALSAPTIWNDTFMVGQFTGGTVQHINMVSIGTILDPSSAGFNDPTLYLGEMKLTNNNAYMVDKVDLLGVYDFNPAKTSVVDTLRLTFLKGYGTATATDDIFSGYALGAGGHYGAATFLDIDYDSVRNRATGATAQVQDVLLNSASWGDTTAGGFWNKEVTLTTPLSLMANGKVAMSMSFISGDPAKATSLATADTIFFASGTQKFNAFRPVIMFAADGSGNPAWAPYNVADSNVGLFRRLPAYLNGWANTYVPTWAWSTSGGTAASSLQFPYVSWHISCSTCTDIYDPTVVSSIASVNEVTATPNPASTELNVSYKLTAMTNVSVTLSDLVGQVVATQQIANTNAGMATFNTATLAPGVYFYTLNANGERTTGRIVVAH